MKIINLQVDNYKRIKAVEIAPDGSLVILAGRGAQGKTSILDAIWAALEGGDASRLTKQPIRAGESHASVRLDLGEYIVTRRWRKDDVGTLTVESPRGAAYSSPQKILDGLIGSMSMDPMAFIKQKPTDQVATLVTMLGKSLGFDPVEIEERRAAAFEARRVANAGVKNAQARVDAHPDYPADTPTEPVDAAAVAHEYVVAMEDIALRDAAAARVDAVTAALLAEYARHDERIQALSGEQTDALAAIAAFGPNDVDPAEILGRIESANDTNKVIDGNNRRLEDVAALADVQAIADAEDAKLTAIAAEKAVGLATATFPLKELSFDDTGVTYNGIPLAQASGKEKRIVGVAIAMASNPELRVLRIDEGESLDSEGLAHIAQLADENDYQVWMSRVDESGTAGVVIEDGMVAE